MKLMAISNTSEYSRAIALLILLSAGIELL